MKKEKYYVRSFTSDEFDVEFNVYDVCMRRRFWFDKTIKSFNGNNRLDKANAIKLCNKLNKECNNG